MIRVDRRLARGFRSGEGEELCQEVLVVMRKGEPVCGERGTREGKERDREGSAE